MGTFCSRDRVNLGSNPDGFNLVVWIFIASSGMRKRSFCIFRRIHVRLTLASQVAYERFSFTALPQTDLKHLTSSHPLVKRGCLADCVWEA